MDIKAEIEESLFIDALGADEGPALQNYLAAALEQINLIFDQLEPSTEDRETYKIHYDALVIGVKKLLQAAKERDQIKMFMAQATIHYGLLEFENFVQNI